MSDVRGFYAELGIALRQQEAPNVAVNCFASPREHRNDDRSRSCSVHTGNGVFNCHGCGAHGGAYDAAVALGRPPRQAMDLLRRYGFADDEPEPAPPIPKPNPQVGEVHRYHAALINNPAHLKRLEELREWTVPAIKHLEIGIDLGWSPKRGGGPIVFPSSDSHGNLTGMVHYQPNVDKRQGSKSIAEGPRQLFPAPESIDSPVVWLVEGEPDAVTACSLGIPAVGVPGVRGWKAEWIPRFEHFQTIFICTDVDQPGEELAEELAGAFFSIEATVKHIRLDVLSGGQPGYDITDAVLEARDNGVGIFRRALTGIAGSLC